ncbi:hypothetical protein Q3G72_007167 [Acer saccharum]|nr:hypothetical protein Q3G72_007167 [Acer saccharum]
MRWNRSCWRDANRSIRDHGGSTKAMRRRKPFRLLMAFVEAITPEQRNLRACREVLCSDNSSASTKAMRRCKPVYVFSWPLLKLLHQNNEISGKYYVLIILQVFAYAINFPIHKFLPSQSIVQVLTIITMAALAFHALLNWLLITKPNQGLVGAAMALL